MNWHLLSPDVLCGCEGHQTKRRPENDRPYSSEMGLTACKLISLFLSLAVKSKNACPSTEGHLFFWGLQHWTIESGFVVCMILNIAAALEAVQRGCS